MRGLSVGNADDLAGEAAEEAAAARSVDSESIPSSSKSLRARLGPSPGRRVISSSPGGYFARSFSAAGIVPVLGIEVVTLDEELRASYDVVAVGYADCGTYGALDEVCERLSMRRLPGLHCYDVYAGAERLQRFFDEQPGTYVLTDFLARSFARTVLSELGLDRYPELRDTYFGHYTRVVWLAQNPDDETRALAAAAASSIGLPLATVEVGTTGLERELERLVLER